MNDTHRDAQARQAEMKNGAPEGAVPLIRAPAEAGAIGYPRTRRKQSLQYTGRAPVGLNGT